MAKRRQPQNRMYYSVVGVSLVLILALTIVLIIKLKGNSPETQETDNLAQESLDLDIDFTFDEDILDSFIASESTTGSENIITGEIQTETAVIIPETTAHKEDPVIQTSPPVKTDPPATKTAAATTAKTEAPSPTAADNLLEEISLPLSFGHISAAKENYVNTNANNDMYQGDYSGSIVYKQQNIDKLSVSGGTKSKVDQIVKLSKGGSQDLYGSLSGDKLSLISDSYPLSANGTFSANLSPARGVTEHKNISPVIPGGSASLRVYYLAENLISYVYSESYQADLVKPSTLAWFEIRGELYPE